MKKTLALLVSACLMFSLAGCGAASSSSSASSDSLSSSSESASAPSSTEDTSSDSAPEETPSGGGGKTLVVYYSATGNTEAVAGYIAGALGADTLVLEPTEPYTAEDLRWTDEQSRASREHNDPSLRDVPLTETTPAGWDSYDTVFIGYPIWWGIAAWPVDTFIKANDFTGKTVIPFCTSSSSGLGQSGTLLAEMAGTGDWLEGQRFSSGASELSVTEWVSGLGLAASDSAETASAPNPTDNEDRTSPAVYFTSDISPAGLMAVYEALGWQPTGKVAVKLSTGEPPASNYLAPELIKDLVQSVDGTIVECNTAYGGSRAETAMHRQVAEDHGFTAIAEVDILDADGSMELPTVAGAHFENNLVGAHFANYDSYIILSHFKGHAMAGFGGAIKNISIGLGSSEGKCVIHSGGKSHTSPWGGDQTAFTESMAEAGKAVSDYLGEGERIVYINVLNNISIDCDCNGHPAAPDIHDIGIVASLNPVAADQACIDLAFATEGSDSLQQRVESLDGLHTLEHAEAIGLGSRAYELVNLDG